MMNLKTIAYLVIITIPIVYALATIVYWNTHSNLYILTHIDPILFSKNVKYPTIVYVATYTLNPFNKSKILKIWEFGNLKIVKYIVDSVDEVKKLKSYLGVESIMSMYRHVLLPEPLDKIMSMYVEKKLFETIAIAVATGKDVKLEFHKITWKYIGRNVTVCVIDTGVDYLHPDLRHSIKALVSFRVFTEAGQPLLWVKGVNKTVLIHGKIINVSTLEGVWKFEQEVYLEVGEYPWMDTSSHGTHVIGIIAGSGVLSRGKVMGIAPGVEVVSIKVFNEKGYASIDSILDSLEWLYKIGIDYLNIDVCSFSWGVEMSSDGSDPISLAVSKLIKDKGVIIVVAMGNSYIFPYTINVPAVCHGCIAVGAYDPFSNSITLFSSSGPTPDGRIKPDFVADGVWVLSTIPVTVTSYYELLLRTYHLDDLLIYRGYAYMSGTSMATPIVAGFVAKIVEKYKILYGRKPTLEEVINELLHCTERINPFFKDIWSGWGYPREDWLR